MIQISDNLFDPILTHPKDAYRLFFYYANHTSKITFDLSDSKISVEQLTKVYLPLSQYAKKLQYTIVAKIDPILYQTMSLPLQDDISKSLLDYFDFDEILNSEQLSALSLQIQPSDKQKSDFDWLILVRIAAIVFLGLATINFIQTQAEKSAYQKNLEEFNQLSTPIYAWSATFEANLSDETIKNHYNQLLINRHQQMATINKDYVGWIRITDTDIDFPFVLGQDNDYYLYHDIYRKRSNYGAIFMDMRNHQNFSDQHIVLYGHSIRHQAMFGSLIHYLNQDYAKKHSMIEIVTQDTIYTYQIFSAHIIDATKTTLPVPLNDVDIGAFAQEYAQQSAISNAVSLDEMTQLLTLVSCEYTFEDGRIFVHAKLVDAKPFNQ